MDFIEIFAKIQAIVGNLFLLFHALCGTVFSRFSSLVFASAVAPCAKNSFYRENILFDHISSLCPSKTAGSRSDRVRAICAYVTGRRNVLAKAFSLAFSHTRTTAKTRNAFSLLSALFERYAHIASGFTTTPLVSFALTHIMRACAFLHVAAHPITLERLLLLCKNAPNLLPSKAQKARSSIIFCQKGFPMSFFLAARRF